MTILADALQQLQFRKTADAAVRKAAKQADTDAFQLAVTKQHRTARKRLGKSFSSEAAAIRWSAAAVAASPGDRELAALLAGSRKQQQAAFKLATEQLLAGATDPLAWLCGLTQLVRFGRELDSRTFASLYCMLSAVADVVPNADDSIADEDRLMSQLVCEGEIPWLRGIVFSDLKRGSDRKDGADVLREGLDTATDTDGFIHAEWSDQADQWLAPLVRSVVWGAALDANWLTAKTTERFADAVRHCATLLTSTGLVCTPPKTLRQEPSAAGEIVAQGLRAVGIRADSPFLALAEGYAARKGNPKRKTKRSGQVLTSNQSDWGEAAVMRSGLQPDSDVCHVTWDQDEARLHLAVLGTPLISGVWSSEAIVNGTSTGPIQQWGCSCWFSDDEAAFLELEADPSPSIHVVRHVMLSLKDRTGVICESVTTDQPDAKIELKTRVSLAADPLAVTNSITREIALHADCVSTRVIPAWLEDDRVQSAPGSCEKQDGLLLSSAEGVGGATAPLVLDWHPERQAQDADWTRLTVTESRAILTGQAAAGFRVRIGRHQMLIFRSLRAGDTPRAVLGQHTTNETIYGRVKKSGDVSPLVMVDGE